MERVYWRVPPAVWATYENNENNLRGEPALKHTMMKVHSEHYGRERQDRNVLGNWEWILHYLKRDD